MNVSSDCLKEMYFEVLESLKKSDLQNVVCDIFDKVFNFQNIRIPEFHTINFGLKIQLQVPKTFLLIHINNYSEIL